MDKLEFDLDKLTHARDKCQKLYDEIEKYKENLAKDLDALKRDWNTSAGKKFFQELDEDWTDHVDEYLKTMDVVKSLIEEAIKQYSEVATEAKALKL